MSAIIFRTKTREASLSGAERAHCNILYEKVTEGFTNGNPPSRFMNPDRIKWANTALLVGSDAIAFATKLHNQCEIHGWVEAKDALWLRGIIQLGLDYGIFREKLKPRYGKKRDPVSLGWENVMAILDGTEDVVTSYTVTEYFPNPYVAYGITSGEDDMWDAWGSLTEDEQWELAMEGLRQEMAPWSPRTLRQLFGDGENLLEDEE